MPETALYPNFDRMLPRAAREQGLKQRGRVIWFYGLSGAGKSTLAIALERRLHAEGYVTQLLDGDNVRTGLNRGLGFGDADRAENLRRVAEVAKLFAHAGIVTLCSFITPMRAHRAAARTIIGDADWVPIYVKASFDTCARRDPKGLYAKALAGKVRAFTGKDSPFEAPDPSLGDTDYILDTEAKEPGPCLDEIHAAILPHIQFL